MNKRVLIGILDMTSTFLYTLGESDKKNIIRNIEQVCITAKMNNWTTMFTHGEFDTAIIDPLEQYATTTFQKPRQNFFADDTIWRYLQEQQLTDLCLVGLYKNQCVRDSIIGSLQIPQHKTHTILNCTANPAEEYFSPAPLRGCITHESIDQFVLYQQLN